jgi:UDPglucose--hexose-1-phosphate uridylyltransferase
MTELRQDPVSGRLVIIAPRRSTRPHTLVAPDRDGDRGVGECPFCTGQEAMTPPEISRTGDGSAGRPGWRVRVFPNLYPITDTHEVVVLSPDHGRSFAQLSDDEAVEVMLVLRDRVRVHLVRLPYAVAVINHRRAAGASIAHPHAQVVGLDFVPPEVEGTRRRQEAAAGDLVDHDAKLARENGLVVDDSDTVTWCPFASTSPFQTRLVHRDAGPRFDQASDDDVATIARATRAALIRLRDVLEDPPYNLVVHTADIVSGAWPRWHVEITPRIGIAAGFEQATGVFVNTVRPEAAAEDLRDA